MTLLFSSCVELFALRQINRSSLLQFVDRKTRWLVTSTGFLPFLCWNRQCCFGCRAEVNEFWVLSGFRGRFSFIRWFFVCSFVFVPCEEKADLFFCWDVMCISLNRRCIFEPLLYLRTYVQFTVNTIIVSFCNYGMCNCNWCSSQPGHLHSDSVR